MKKERPIVVSVLAVIMAIVGIMDIFYALRLAVDSWVIGYGVIAIILSGGLWFMWSWAWFGMILFQLFALGYAIYDWIINREVDFLAIFFAVFIIWYFLRADTRKQFFPAKNEPEPGA